MSQEQDQTNPPNGNLPPVKPVEESEPVEGLWLNFHENKTKLISKKSLALILAIVSALSCFGILTGIVSWFGSQKTPILFTIFVSDQEDEGIAPVPFGQEDLQILTSGNVFDRINTNQSASNNHEQNINILQKIEEVPSSENIVLYICARPVIDDKGKVAILSSDSRLEQSVSGGILTNTIQLNDIFIRLANCKASQKLLILDIFNPILSIPAGITNKDIPRRVEDEFTEGNYGVSMREKNRTAFKMLMSCSPGQASMTSPPLGHSVFCYFFALALNGKLPSDKKSSINRLGKVYLSDLNTVMFPHVDRWVEENELERQIPQILGESFPNQKDMLLAIPKVRFVPSQAIASTVATTFEDSLKILPNLKKRWIGNDKDNATDDETKTNQKPNPDGVKINENLVKNDKDKESPLSKSDKGKEKDQSKSTELVKDKTSAGSTVPNNSKDNVDNPSKQLSKSVPTIITEAWELHDRWVAEGKQIEYPRILNRTASIARNALLCYLLGLEPERYSDRITFALEQIKQQMQKAVQTTTVPSVYSNLGMLLEAGLIRDNPAAIASISTLVQAQKSFPANEQEWNQLVPKLVQEFTKSHPNLSGNDIENIFVNSTLVIPNLSANKFLLLAKMLRFAMDDKSLKTSEARLLDRLASLCNSPKFDPIIVRECIKINLLCSKVSSKWRVYSRMPFIMDKMAEQCMAGTWLTENCMASHGVAALDLFADAEKYATFLEGINTVLLDAYQILWLTLQDIASYQISPIEFPAGWYNCSKSAIVVFDRLSDLDSIKNEKTLSKANAVVSLLRIAVDDLAKAYEGVHILVNSSSIADFEKLSTNDLTSPAVLQDLNANLRLGRISLQDRLRLITVYFRVADKTAQLTLKKEASEMLAGFAPPNPTPYDKPSQGGLNERDIPFLQRILLGIISLKFMNPDLMRSFSIDPELEVENILSEVKSGKRLSSILDVNNSNQSSLLQKKDIPGKDGTTPGNAFHFPNLGRRSLREQFDNITEKKALWASCNKFFRDSFMYDIPAALLKDKRMSFRINMAYPGWISNIALDDPDKNPLLIKDNEDRLNHLGWVVSKLRHSSRLGIDREFNADIVGVYGAKFDLLPNYGLSVDSPTPTAPPVTSKPVIITIPWSNEGISETDLAKLEIRLIPGETFPFSGQVLSQIKTSTGGTLDVAIERLPETGSIVTKTPIVFVLEFQVNQKVWFSRITIEAEDDGSKPNIFVYDKTEGGIALGSELNLRGSGSIQSIFPKIKQESGKPASYTLSVQQLGVGVLLGPVPLSTISGIATPIALSSKTVLDNSKDNSQSSPPTVKSVDAVQGGYPIQLPGQIQIEIRDPALSDKPVATRTLRINRIDPADLVELVSVETNTDSSSGPGPSRKSRLRVSLRAKRALKDSPPCRVQIILDGDLPGSPITSASGNISGIVPPDGKSILVLEAFGVSVAGNSSEMSQFTLSVDGLPMTYRFNADFQPGGPLQSAELLRLPALGLRAKSAIPSKPSNPAESTISQDPVLSLEAWASQAPSGSTMRLTLLGGDQFNNPEKIELLPGPMKTVAILQPGEKGAWEFSCDEGPWKREWQTTGLRGRKKIRLELLDAQGALITARQSDIIIDPTPPRFGQFFGLPEIVGPGSTNRFAFLVTDPESGITSVSGYIGSPTPPAPSGTMPPSLAPPAVQVIPSGNTSEAVVIIPVDAKGSVTINLKAVNGAGLETAWVKTIAVNEKLAPPAPAVQGTVTEAGRPQKGLTVILKDDKGKELEKAVTDENGTYLLANLKPGKGTVEVTKRSSGRSAKKPVILQPGPPIQVDLSMLE